MISLFGLIAFALLAGVFFGLGTPRKRKQRALPNPGLAPLPPASELPGADPTRPIVVASPAVIEGHAEREACPVCASPVRCVQHRAERVAGERLRIARVRCPRCGFELDLHFVLETAPR